MPCTYLFLSASRRVNTIVKRDHRELDIITKYSGVARAKEIHHYPFLFISVKASTCGSGTAIPQRSIDKRMQTRRQGNISMRRRTTTKPHSTAMYQVQAQCSRDTYTPGAYRESPLSNRYAAQRRRRSSVLCQRRPCCCVIRMIRARCYRCL